MKRSPAQSPFPIAARRRPARPGFTMAEVLFAIIILGLGLILIAAAFPVGAVQSARIHDSAVASLVGRLAYDQLTQVSAGDVTPNNNWSSLVLNQEPAASPPAPPPPPWNPPINRYCKLTVAAANVGTTAATPGRALAMAFLDGTQTTTMASGSSAPKPDLRAKLVYPAPFYYEEITNPATWPIDPTWADDGIQDQDDASDLNRVTTWPGWASMLGIAAYDCAALPFRPVAFLTAWGFKADAAGNWSENVQWVSAGDRRYYWYAFYRQMYEADFVHPLQFSAADPAHAKLLSLFQADLITRRTYRVTIVACKVPAQFNIQFDNAIAPAPAEMKQLSLTQIEAPGFFQGKSYVRDGYFRQWTEPNPKYASAPILGPVRVPQHDADIPGLSGTELTLDATHTWLSGTRINALVDAAIAKTGGIVVDAWGTVFQIAEVTRSQAGSSAIRLDRAIKPLPAGYGWAAPNQVRDVLPLWFNPQAVAAFPTIVTKQAVKP